MDSGAGFCSRPRFQSPIPRAMTTPATPSAPQPAGDDRKLVSVDETYLAPTFEDKLQLFWKNYGTAVLSLCGLVFVGILAKGGWDYLQAGKEVDVQKAYAAAATSDQLKTFAAAHAEHTLAGLGGQHFERGGEDDVLVIIGALVADELVIPRGHLVPALPWTRLGIGTVRPGGPTTMARFAEGCGHGPYLLSACSAL